MKGNRPYKIPRRKLYKVCTSFDLTHYDKTGEITEMKYDDVMASSEDDALKQMKNKKSHWLPRGLMINRID